MTRNRAIVFDLDDTLYPERAFAFSGFDAVAKAFVGELGDPTRTATHLRRLFDTEHRPRVFNTLLRELGIVEDAALIARMVDAYRHHTPSILLHDDADRALRRLAGQVKIGLITDGPQRTQRAKIDALELTARIDAIVVTSELGPDCGKPAPDAFRRFADMLDVPHETCVYVADNPAKDFVAPNRLGWLSVRVLRTDGIYRDAPIAPGGCPTHTIDTLDQLDALL